MQSRCPFPDLNCYKCKKCVWDFFYGTEEVFDQIPGNILKNFLALIYTGASSSLQTRSEQNALKELCLQLKLKSVVSQTPTIDSGRIQTNFGFKEVDPPSYYVASTDKFMDAPVRDISAEDDFTFKREPEEFDVDPDVGNSYFEEPVEVNISSDVRTSKNELQPNSSLEHNYSTRRLIGSRTIRSAAYSNHNLLALLYLNNTQNSSVN
jgi:hypothetical protein